MTEVQTVEVPPLPLPPWAVRAVTAALPLVAGAVDYWHPIAGLDSHTAQLAFLLVVIVIAGLVFAAHEVILQVRAHGFTKVAAVNAEAASVTEAKQLVEEGRPLLADIEPVLKAAPALDELTTQILPRLEAVEAKVAEAKAPDVSPDALVAAVGAFLKSKADAPAAPAAPAADTPPPAAA